MEQHDKLSFDKFPKGDRHCKQTSHLDLNFKTGPVWKSGLALKNPPNKTQKTHLKKLIKPGLKCFFFELFLNFSFFKVFKSILYQLY